MANPQTDAHGIVIDDLKRRIAAFDAAKHYGTYDPTQPDRAPARPDGEATGWQDPVALAAALPPVEPFTHDLLPAAFLPWMEDAADRMQCPLDFLGMGAMVAEGTVVGRQIGIRPKRHDDWLVVPNLWGVAVGLPSALKSPALKVPMDMLSCLEMAAKKDHERDLHAYKVHEVKAKVAAKQAEANLKRAMEKGRSDEVDMLAERIVDADSEDPPARRRYVTNDSTVEKLGELLAANPRGILVFRDELSGFLQTFNKKGREGSRSFYIEAWEGAGSFTFDRIGRGTVEVEAACISLLGGPRGIRRLV